MILSSELFKRGEVDIPPFVFTPIGVVKYFNVLWYTSRCLVHIHDIRTVNRSWFKGELGIPH